MRKTLASFMTIKRKFLISELWILSWNASVQRAAIYASDAEEKERIKFRENIISLISDKILPEYKSPVAENKHEENIQILANQGSKVGKDILLPVGYKIGIAQKLLNLQLKYLWCLGLVSEPPHCPVDRVMIDKTTLKDTINWTQIEDIKTYRKVIEALRHAAAPTGLSLAEWELKFYDRGDA